MPWVRIDENALEHPKIGALSDGAFRLWVQGLAYCQKFLTDGFISALAVRGLRAYSVKRSQALILAALWDEATTGVYVHDYLVWNDSKERVLAKREQGKERIRKLRGQSSNALHRENTSSVQIANASGGVECSDLSESSEVKERGVGKTIPQRAAAFVQWYEDTHERLFHVGYMGANKDWLKTLEMCEKFSDDQLRDAALVWFGQDDDFATEGTRTIVKFASRATGCLQQARARGLV